MNRTSQRRLFSKLLILEWILGNDPLFSSVADVGRVFAQTKPSAAVLNHLALVPNQNGRSPPPEAVAVNAPARCFGASGPAQMRVRVSWRDSVAAGTAALVSDSPFLRSADETGADHSCHSTQLL
jgi:hypothetical protein